MRQLQGHVTGSPRRQDFAEDHRSPPQRVLRARGHPAEGTEWFPTELFYHRYDFYDSSVTGPGAEETNSDVCMLLSTLPKRTNPLIEPASGRYSPILACHRI